MTGTHALRRVGWWRRSRPTRPARPARVEVVVNLHGLGDGAEPAVEVLIGGRRALADVTVIDPGRGHYLSDFRDVVDTAARGSSPDAADLIRRWGAAAEESPYITDDIGGQG